jgi:hypothetical protein
MRAIASETYKVIVIAGRQEIQEWQETSVADEVQAGDRPILYRFVKEPGTCCVVISRAARSFPLTTIAIVFAFIVIELHLHLVAFGRLAQIATAVLLVLAALVADWVRRRRRSTPAPVPRPPSSDGQGRGFAIRWNGGFENASVPPERSPLPRSHGRHGRPRPRPWQSWQ